MDQISYIVIAIFALAMVASHIRITRQIAETSKRNEEARIAELAAWAISPINPASPNFDQAKYDAAMAEQAAQEAKDAE